MVNRISRQLHYNPPLRKYILKLGYEYYRPLGKRFTEPKNPLAQLGRLSEELIVKILEWTHAISLAELPNPHPVLLYSPCRNRNRGPLPTINLPTSYKRGRWRKEWLAGHPGTCGPFFEVMFVSKLFYALARPIRFKDVHIESFYDENDQNFNKLSTLQILRDATKNIHMKIFFRNDEPSTDMMTALGAVPKLQHICVSLQAFRISLSLRCWGTPQIFSDSLI